MFSRVAKDLGTGRFSFVCLWVFNPLVIMAYQNFVAIPASAQVQNSPVIAIERNSNYAVKKYRVDRSPASAPVKAGFR